MNNDTDRNHISLGYWMWMIFVTAIPIVGQIMVLVWAFTGDNESRKNYFRAMLVWLLLFIALFIVLALIGNLPALLNFTLNSPPGS
jgi:hypothetical protein